MNATTFNALGVLLVSVVAVGIFVGLWWFGEAAGSVAGSGAVFLAGLTLGGYAQRLVDRSDAKRQAERDRAAS